MNRYILTPLLAASVVLPGCGSLPDATRVLVGSAQLTQASVVREALIDYLPTETGLDADLAYLDAAYARLASVEADTSIVSLALETPDAFVRIGESFERIRGVVIAHSNASDTPIPASLVAFDAGVVPAYQEIQAAIRANDRTREVVELVRLLRPLALVLL